MSKIILFLFLFVSIGRISFAQNFPQENFFQSLINNNSDITDFIHPDELLLSERFNITYVNQKIKFLVSYDIESEIKEKVKSGELKYSIEEEKQEGEFSKILFTIVDINYKRIFYFQNGKLISPLKFYSNSWKKAESKYFNFLISEEKFFNNYCMHRLDDYAEKVADLLHMTISEKKLLEKQKFLYVFCKNQEEIKLITGYESRGQFILNMDAVVTTYPCHFHEISHFLINYKLKHLPLYTLPFIQEGFAVATGGRGGQCANVLTNVGFYLIKNGIADYKDLFKSKSFRNEDASISYPISGLFTKYLLYESPEKYINFYRDCSGEIKKLNSIDSDFINKEITGGFENYLEKYKGDTEIYFAGSENNIEIKSSKSFFLSPRNLLKNYESSKFSEMFKDREYKGEKYYFALDTNEINIYNLYSNELIASYVNSFSANPVKYFNMNEFRFYISKTLLDEDINSLKRSY